MLFSLWNKSIHTLHITAVQTVHSLLMNVVKHNSDTWMVIGIIPWAVWGTSALTFSTCQISPLFFTVAAPTVQCCLPKEKLQRDKATLSWARIRALARFGRFWWFDFALFPNTVPFMNITWLWKVSFDIAVDRDSPVLCVNGSPPCEFHSHLQIRVHALTVF